MNKNKIDALDMLAAISPGGIELQEAIGQQELVNSQVLPTDGLEWRWQRADKFKVSPKEYLTTLGFVFGENQDDMFINVTFPEGWEMQPTDHSMWSYINDPNGRERVAIFYKAAFYDCSAHFDLTCRFNHSRIYENDEGYKDGVIQCKAYDGKEPIYTSKEYTYTEKHGDDFWVAQDAADADVIAWLTENYPDWKSPMGHWAKG